MSQESKLKAVATVVDKTTVATVKKAKQAIVENMLTLWNARLDMLIAAGVSPAQVIDHISAGADICGCGGDSPICACDCPPPEPESFASVINPIDRAINDMNRTIIELSKEIQIIQAKLK